MLKKIAICPLVPLIYMLECRKFLFTGKDRMSIYNKLVRKLIPVIMEKDGKTFDIYIYIGRPVIQNGSEQEDA